MAVTPFGVADLDAWAEKALARGATHLVLRLEAAPEPSFLYEWARRWQGIPWLVHRRWAKTFYGYGMHFPAGFSTPLPKPHPSYLYGASCHNLLEVEAVLSWVDYVWLGPLFPTASHPQVEPLALATLQKVANRFPQVPIIVIGGLTTQDRIEAARTSGAAGFASIRYFSDG